MLTAQEGKPSTYALRSLGYEVELSSTAVDDVVAEGVDESKVVPLQSWTTLAMAKMNGETRGFIPAVRARRRRYQKQICRAVRVVPVGEFSVLLSPNRPDMPTTSRCSHAANIRPDSFPTLTGPWDVSHNKGDSAEARGYAIVCRLAWFPWERDLVLYMAGPRGPMVASGRAGWTNRKPGDPPPQIVPRPIRQGLRAPCRQFTQPQTLPTPHTAWVKPSCGAWPRHGRVGLERVLHSC